MTAIVLHSEGLSELNELRAASGRHERFIFLKGSLRILDQRGFDEALESLTGPAWFFARPSCYLAVYESRSLREALHTAPHDDDKETSIRWESRLHELLRYPAIWPDVSDRTAKRIDVVDGQPELVIGNDIVEKSKGTAHCPRCPHAPVPGLCDHYLARFGMR